jgi:hypothetical protein
LLENVSAGRVLKSAASQDGVFQFHKKCSAAAIPARRSSLLETQKLGHSADAACEIDLIPANFQGTLLRRKVQNALSRYRRRRLHRFEPRR